MTAFNPSDADRLLGRFVVKTPDARHTGLTAGEVADLLDRPGAEPIEIFRIHRVREDGGWELSGVPPHLFRQQDCLLFSRQQVREARRVFDALVSLSTHTPPPCEIVMQFAHVRSFSAAHVVALIFPAPCMESVGSWLAGAGVELGDHADGSPAVLDAYRTAPHQVVLECTLPAARSA